MAFRVMVDQTGTDTVQIQTECRIRKILRKAGVKVNASICSLHGHPMFRQGGLCNPDPKIRALAAKKVERTLRIGTFLGAKHYVYWVARDGFESYPGCDFKRCYD